MHDNVQAKSRFHFFRKQGGFTLTEIAIVTGIVGLVLGAIWVAANRAKINYYSNMLGTDISYIANQYSISTTFGAGDFPQSAPCQEYSCTGPTGIPLVPTQQCYWCSTTEDQTAIAAKSGLIPPDLFYSSTSPTPLQNKFGGQVTIQTYSGAQGTQPGNATSGFHNDVLINTGPIPTAACLKILLAYGPLWMAQGFEQVSFNNFAVNGWFGSDGSLLNTLTLLGCENSDPVSVTLDFIWPVQSQ